MLVAVGSHKPGTNWDKLCAGTDKSSSHHSILARSLVNSFGKPALQVVQNTDTEAFDAFQKFLRALKNTQRINAHIMCSWAIRRKGGLLENGRIGGTRKHDPFSNIKVAH